MAKNKKNSGNILLVANWESDVGYAWWLMENFWVTISKHFGTKNIDCHLLYPRITQIPESIASTAINTIELDFSDHSPGNALKLYRLIKKHDIKHLYLSDAPTYSWFYILLRIFGIKNIVVHDHTPGERTVPSFPLSIIKNIIQHTPYYTADHFIAVTDFVHQRHIKVNRIPADKCSTASNGIHPYDLKQAVPHYAHHQFGIDEDKQIVVTTGRASYYKGIDFFIRCADELINHQKHEHLHFLFCGDGPDIEDFKLLVQQLNLDGGFTFAGKRSDINKILPSCTVGLHCSDGEVGYSLSILEYMSAGLITIVPDNPSVSLSITDSINGFLYQPRDLTSATEAIKRAIDSETSGALKENAIATVSEKFHIKSTNQNLIEILQLAYS